MAILVVFLALVAVSPAGSVELPADFEFQASVETFLEGRLTESLKDVLGTDRFIPVVHAEVGGRTLDGSRKSVEEAGGTALPGVPVKKKLGMEGGEKKDSTVVRFVRRVVVTLYVDEAIPEGKDDLITDVTKGVMKFDPRRGDEVSIKRIALGPAGAGFSRVFLPPDLYWTVLVIAGVLFLATASFFLLNPFRSLPGVLGNINWEMLRGGQGRGGGEGGGPTFETHNVFQTTPPVAERTSTAGGDSPMPFSFVEPRHLGNLAYLCRSRPDREVATIASYLGPEQMAEFLDFLDPEKQVSVAVEMASTREIEPEEVRALEEDMKNRLDFLVGGESKILNIIDRTSDGVREKIFETLRRRDALAAEALGKKVKSFETVLSELSPEAIQVLNRRVDPGIFAQVLRSLSEELQNKVLDSVSSGVAERLRQEMEMSRPLTAVRISREKKNMVALIRQLLSEGMIEEA